MPLKVADRVLGYQQGLHALLLKRREHIVEPGGGWTAGAERLLERRDEITFAVAIGALDHGADHASDLLDRCVPKVGVDGPGEHRGQVVVKVVLDHRAQLVRANDHEVRERPAPGSASPIGGRRA